MEQLEKLTATARSLFSCKKGAVGGGIMGIGITLVTMSILLMIGILVFSEVSGAIPQGGMTVAENTTLDEIRTTTLSSYSLAVITMIVLAAGAVLFVVFTFGSRG